MAAAVAAAERKAILADLEAQDSRLRRITDDMKGVLTRADQAGVSINAATMQTVLAAEVSTRRTLDRAFWLTLVLILVLLVGIPASVIVYRPADNKGGASRTAAAAAAAVAPRPVVFPGISFRAKFPAPARCERCCRPGGRFSGGRRRR